MVDGEAHQSYCHSDVLNPNPEVWVIEISVSADNTHHNIIESCYYLPADHQRKIFPGDLHCFITMPTYSYSKCHGCHAGNQNRFLRGQLREDYQRENGKRD